MGAKGRQDGSVGSRHDSTLTRKRKRCPAEGGSRTVARTLARRVPRQRKTDYSARPAHMTTIFAKVPAEMNFPAEEGEVLRFWKERKIFEKSLEERRGKPAFVFYEGPPTANGMPHNGHVLTRVIKDLFPRYKTMRGFSVPRKAGWDTHGLPVEVEVEKELHIHGKAAIEAYGVEPFVAKCIQSVFRYTSEWETLTDRVAFWCDLKDAYVTYHKEYVESVWWALSELLKKGLLYKGHKVVWWWAQGGTALSAAEVGLGYKSVEDPSVFVAFPLVAEPDVSLLVWTTTPWTLPSNMYAAVNPDFHYVVVKVDGGDHAGRRFLVAKDLVPSIGKKLKSDLTIERETTGASLIGQKYSRRSSCTPGARRRSRRRWPRRCSPSSPAASSLSTSAPAWCTSRRRSARTTCWRTARSTRW